LLQIYNSYECALEPGPHLLNSGTIDKEKQMRKWQFQFAVSVHFSWAYKP